ncbi:MAG: YqgE/AlgH family protein [Bacteroidota bacterium]
MKTTEIIETGKLLLADPFMLDPNFKRSVVLLCDHHSEGTVGFILNKSVKMQINELLADFPEFESEVHFGGPVQTDTIHYIHRIGEKLIESQHVCDGIYWGGDFDQLKFLVETGQVDSADIRFFVGYSGWSSGQLNEEMAIGSWMLGNASASYVFKKEIGDLWSEVLQEKGDVFSVISTLPDYVNWN